MSQSTEHKLIDFAEKISMIASCSHRYTSGLADHIDSLGQPLEEITVSELAKIESYYRREFNSTEGES